MNVCSWCAYVCTGIFEMIQMMTGIFEMIQLMIGIRKIVYFTKNIWYSYILYYFYKHIFHINLQLTF